MTTIYKPQTLNKNHLRLLGLIGDGLNTKEIAVKLNISASTVEYHRNTVKRILGTNNPAQLIRTAIAFGLSSL